MKINTVKLCAEGVIINGQTFLPDGNDNHLRRTYDAWVAEGNTPEPLGPLLELTALQRICELEAQISPRHIRGGLLGDVFALAHLQEVEDAIAALRDEM